MTARDRFETKIKCADCGQTGVVGYSELENPIFARGNMDKQIEHLPDGFSIAPSAGIDLKCDKCGSLKVHAL